MPRLIVLTLCLLLAPLTARAEEHITVFAATCYADAFADLAVPFERDHGLRVDIRFGSAGDLFAEMAGGADVDVYAPDSRAWMDRAVSAGLVDPDMPRIFARNALVLAVPAQDPARVVSVRSLLEDRVSRVAVGDPESVAAGAYAREALQSMGVWEGLRTRLVHHRSVREVLDALRLGKADAGFVYLSGAADFPRDMRTVETLPLPEPPACVMAVVDDTEHFRKARSFVDFVLSRAGQKIIELHGFRKP